MKKMNQEKLAKLEELKKKTIGKDDSLFLNDEELVNNSDKEDSEEEEILHELNKKLKSEEKTKEEVEKEAEKEFTEENLEEKLNLSKEYEGIKK